MLDDNLFHLFGKASKKIYFVYNLSSGRFDYLNNAVEHIWEICQEDVLDSSAKLIAAIHPDDRSAVETRFRQVAKGEERHSSIKFRLQLPRENCKEVQVDIYPIKDDSGKLTHIAGEAEDVTQQSQYIDYLLEFSSRKDTALEMVAHDLLGPLSVVKGIASLLESEHQEQKYGEVSNYTEIITRAYDTCVELITNVLSEEHLKSPAIYVKMERFDLVDKVKKLLESYRMATRSEYTFELICDSDKLHVELDELKLIQVLNNLVTNSVKFTKPGGEISVTLRKEGQKLLIIHTDTGIGIPKELQPQVFDRHNQTSRVGLRGEPTHGVGLAIIRDLIEVQGGKIWFESEEGKGTTFFMSFSQPGL